MCRQLGEIVRFQLQLGLRMERPGVFSGLCVFPVEFFHYFSVSCPHAKAKMPKEGLGRSNILLCGIFPPTSETEGRKYRKENLRFIFFFFFLKGKILNIHRALNFELSFVIEACSEPFQTQLFLSNKPPSSKADSRESQSMGSKSSSSHFMAFFPGDLKPLEQVLGLWSQTTQLQRLQLNSCVKYPLWSGRCREIRNNPQSPSIKLN